MARYHNDCKRFVGASRRTGVLRVGGHMPVKPTLAEQGVDLDALLDANRDMIERFRKGIGYEA